VKGFAYALIACAMVSACQKSANTAANTATVANTQVASNAVVAAIPADAKGQDAFVGKYQMAGDEGPDKGEIVIAAVGDGYLGQVDVGSPGCGGGAVGEAKRKGDVLRLVGRLKDYDDTCEIDITRQADGSLTTEEADGNCRNFHGVKCDFNGTAKRTSSPAAAPRN
jgi:hypothetical protein